MNIESISGIITLSVKEEFMIYITGDTHIPLDIEKLNKSNFQTKI